MRLTSYLSLLASACFLSSCGGGGGGGGGNPAPPNPLPTVSSLSPASTLAGGGAFQLAVNGANFANSAQVQWNGSNRTTTFVSTTQLTASIAAADIAVSGSVNVTVSNPSPGGGLSGGSAFVVADVIVDASSLGALVQADEFGVNMGVGDDITSPAGKGPLLATAGVQAIRWPGGIPSDLYHWQTDAFGPGACGFSPNPPYGANPNSNFDTFMKSFVMSGNFDVAITVNYGTNATCTGPADPNEAAAWVAYAKQNSYPVRFWTVGNEVHRSGPGGEPDLHAMPNDAPTYADAVANQFYPLMKAQDPSAQVGVVVGGIECFCTPADWDTYVLSHAKYDFVEVHYYSPENPGHENDMTLLSEPQLFLQQIHTVQSELTAAGKAGTPIIVGEFNSEPGSPDQQSVSIVNGLYMGMLLGEILDSGVALATAQTGLSANCFPASSQAGLYSWQNFGTESFFSYGTPNYGCASAQSTAYGTPFPAARAYQLMSMIAHPGEHMLTVSVANSSKLAAFSSTMRSGYGLMLFNLDPASSATLTVLVKNASHSSFTANTSSYDKTIYDQTKNGTWAGLSSASLGTVENSFPITLTPWSMTAVDLTPSP